MRSPRRQGLAKSIEILRSRSTSLRSLLKKRRLHFFVHLYHAKEKTSENLRILINSHNLSDHCISIIFRCLKIVRDSSKGKKTELVRLVLKRDATSDGEESNCLLHKI